LVLPCAVLAVQGCGEGTTRASKAYRRVAKVATERVIVLETVQSLDAVRSCLLAGTGGRLNLESGPRFGDRERVVVNQPQALLIRVTDVGALRQVVAYKRKGRVLSPGQRATIAACSR
jgi:hypothetical protein